MRLDTAAVRTGNDYKLFVNGQQVGATQTRAGALAVNTSPVSIGAYATNGANSFNGHIDEVRISKGIARWTRNFVPPVAAYGDTSSPTPASQPPSRTPTPKKPGRMR